jgi:hypothetical protein
MMSLAFLVHLFVMEQEILDRLADAFFRAEIDLLVG